MTTPQIGNGNGDGDDKDKGDDKQRQTLQAQIIDRMKTNIVRILNEIYAFNETKDPNERKIHVGNITGYATVFNENLRTIANGRRWPASILETWTSLWRAWNNGTGDTEEAQELAKKLMAMFAHIEP